MKTARTLETSLSVIWNTPKKKINPKTLKYFPETKIAAGSDEFVHEAKQEFSTLPKEVRKMDMLNYRQYLLMRKMSLKISKEEFEALFAYEGEEYRQKAFEFLIKKMHIPKELAPQISYCNYMNAHMVYDYCLNYIGINPNLNVDKANYLALLRHELQHFSQNMQIFRHETKGIEFAEFCSKKKAGAYCKNIDHFARNIDIEQLKQMLDKEELEDIVFLKDLLKNNKTAEYNQYMQNEENRLNECFLSEYTDFRNTVIDRLGILRKDTAEGRRAEKMFNETVSEQNYWQADGQVQYAKYYLNCRENEAVLAQDSIIETSYKANNKKRCYMKALRQAQENLGKTDKNSKFIKDFKEERKEREEKGISWKDVLSHLYD